MSEMHVWIVIAAFNEAQVVSDTVSGVLRYFKNVIVVDDFSHDETGRRALAAGAYVLRHSINLGQGAALQTGIAYAMDHGAEYIVTFDADGQHMAEEIAPMLAALRLSGAQIALGSRFLGSSPNIPWPRKVLLKGALLFTRVSTGINLTDMHNGFRILTRQFCEIFEFKQNRMAHASEILSHIAEKKLNYIEFPVTISYTPYSISKGQRGSNAIRILLELIVGRLSK